jgi:hypothetical protein
MTCLRTRIVQGKVPSGERVMIGAMRILRPMAVTSCFAFTVDA